MESVPPPEVGVWRDIVRELERLALAQRMVSDRCHNLVTRIRNLGGQTDLGWKLLAYLLQEGRHGEPTLEGFERILNPSPCAALASDAKRAGKKVAKKRSLKGPKTPAMQDQLKEFKKYLVKIGYDDDASKLYALAKSCWRAHKIAWDKAKFDERASRGYSDSKVLADAYRNLSADQRRSL